MSVLNDGNNLPCVLIDFEKEISNDYDTSLFGTTESVLIMGTASSGTPGLVYPVFNVEHAKYVFGGTYNSENRKIYTLTAGVQDAWDRGCRTIYCMRIGGKDIYKDFKLRGDNDDLRLRVTSIYPSNELKNCYFKYDGRLGIESIAFYKPTTKATINERKSGVVNSTESMIINEIALSEDNGLTSNSRLTEMITLFNEHTNNNVLRLSIVDKNGVDVTISEEAYSLKMGSLFSGVYFIGRDASACQTYTQIKTNIVIDEDDEKPYSSFEGKYFKTLIFNSDVSEDYPIYASSYKEMRSILKAVGITSSESWDFLEVAGMVDRAFVKDETDYEESDLSNFEIYKRLGVGYATTAKAVDRGYKDEKTKVGVDAGGNPIYETKKVRRKPRVIQTPDDDDNKIQGIKEGYYSVLQNEDIKFRVLTCVNADDKIADKIPKADDFKISVANEIELLGDADGNGALITATPIVESDDMTLPKKYTFKFIKVDESEIESDFKEDIYAAKVAEVVPSVAQTTSISNTIANLVADNTVKPGTKVAVMNGSEATIVRISADGYEVLNSTGLEGELICIDDVIYEGKVQTSDDTQYVTFQPLAPDNVATGDNTGEGSGDNVGEGSGDNADEGVVTASEGGAVTYNSKEYMLIESCDNIFVGKIRQDSTTKVAIEPLGDLETMLSSNDDTTLIYCEDNYFKTNRVIIKTGAADFVSMEEFVELLNAHDALGNIFKFELTEEGYTNKDEYLEDVGDVWDADGSAIVEYHMYQTVNGVDQEGVLYELSENKTIDYDFSLYIPYKTTDNFARQLAQHCAYTSLLTATTHGIIGISTLTDVSQKSIMQKVKDVMAIDFNLYAKNYYGRNLLDSKNLPHPIGRYVTTTMFQTTVTDTDGYIYVSNGAPSYAGMISALPLTQSSTAQTIALEGLAYRLTADQLNNITSKGIVTARVSDTLTDIVITDGITMADSNDMYSRIMITRIMDYVGAQLRVACAPFLGGINSEMNTQSLKTAIDSTLKNMEGTLFSYYTFNIVNLNKYQTDMYIDVDHTIRPFGEIRNINNSIRITKQ